MKIEDFAEMLKSFRPVKEVLVSRGYSEEFSENIIENQFNLKKNGKEVVTNSLLEEFLENYISNRFEIRNISFMDEIETINEYTSISGIEGGYLAIRDNDPAIYMIFSDDEDNVELFCQNDKDFFDLLLILAEFSSKVLKGEIDPFDEEIRLEYNDRCKNINPLMDYDMFL